jgi:hypothetical protein
MTIDATLLTEQERRHREVARLVEREVEILSLEARLYGLIVRRAPGNDGFMGEPVPNGVQREFILDPGSIKVRDTGKPRTGPQGEAELRSHFVAQLRRRA